MSSLSLTHMHTLVHCTICFHFSKAELVKKFNPQPEDNRGLPLKAEEIVLCGMCALANNSIQNIIGLVLGRSQNSMSKAAKIFFEAVISRVDDFISWPSEEAEIRRNQVCIGAAEMVRHGNGQTSIFETFGNGQTKIVLHWKWSEKGSPPSLQLTFRFKSHTRGEKESWTLPG